VVAAGRKSVSDADGEATSGGPSRWYLRSMGRRAAVGATPRHRDLIPVPAPRLNAKRRRRPSPSLRPALCPTIVHRCRNCRRLVATRRQRRTEGIKHKTLFLFLSLQSCVWHASRVVCMNARPEGWKNSALPRKTVDLRIVPTDYCCAEQILSLRGLCFSSLFKSQPGNFIAETVGPPGRGPPSSVPSLLPDARCHERCVIVPLPRKEVCSSLPRSL